MTQPALKSFKKKIEKLNFDELNQLTETLSKLTGINGNVQKSILIFLKIEPEKHDTVITTLKELAKTAKKRETALQELEAIATTDQTQIQPGLRLQKTSIEKESEND